MSEDTVYALLWGVDSPIDGVASMPRKQFTINQFAYVEVLHFGAVEIPTVFVVQQFCDTFLVLNMFHVSQGNRFSGLVLELVLDPRFIRESVHLVQKVARGRVELLRPSDLHETASEEDTVFVHDIGVRKVGIAGKESGDFLPSGEERRLQGGAQVFGKHLADRAERISEGRCGRAVVQPVPQDIVGQDKLMIEPIDLQNIGSFFSKPSVPSVLSVEILGIGHPGSAGKDRGAVCEGIDMDMIGHLGIRHDFGAGPKSLDGHDIDEHPMVLFVAEHDFIVGSETETVGFFHAFLDKERESV